MGGLRMIQMKRAYVLPDESDGYRVLVDRLWPRGESKEVEKIDLWLKDIAPSTELRKWYAHDVDKFAEFQIKYQAELREGLASEAFEQLKKIVEEHPIVTLVYAAKDEEHNNAKVLYELLL